MRHVFRRPSASLVISLLALFVALGGVGYAASTINGASIKNRSIAGKKLKKDTVTGTEINEAKLGKVPAAAVADTAANAGHATKADGATAALSAVNSGLLGGEPPSAYKPLAWGTLSDIATGALDAARSSNLHSTKGTQAGTYCFNLDSGTPANVQVTIRDPNGGVANANQYAAQVVMNPAAGTCATASQFAVYTIAGVAYVDDNFFVLVH
jgi:hypothetical protein